jgi:PBP1b-binding outer membrane lipoprotein LpoB
MMRPSVIRHTTQEFHPAWWPGLNEILWMCVVFVFIVGCGSREPAISKGSVKLVEELKTAVAAKKTDWLEAAAKQIDDAHQKGKLSNDEYAALEPIVTDGRQKNWDDANAQMTRLINAQYGR